MSGLTEFQIEVGVQRAPKTALWEPTPKAESPIFGGEIMNILNQKTIHLGGVVKTGKIYRKTQNPRTEICVE